jgi:CheY-like chemotaxis protein
MTDPTNLEVLRVRLSAQGYEVVTARDGEEALQRARELEPDLVLLDVMMPKLDGISVLKELKADVTLRFMPVVLLTAKAETRDSSMALGQALMIISLSRSSKLRWLPASARCSASRDFTILRNCRRHG